MATVAVPCLQRYLQREGDLVNQLEMRIAGATTRHIGLFQVVYSQLQEACGHLWNCKIIVCGKKSLYNHSFKKGALGTLGCKKFWRPPLRFILLQVIIVESLQFLSCE